MQQYKRSIATLIKKSLQFASLRQPLRLEPEAVFDGDGLKRKCIFGWSNHDPLGLSAVFSITGNLERRCQAGMTYAKYKRQQLAYEFHAVVVAEVMRLYHPKLAQPQVPSPGYPRRMFYNGCFLPLRAPLCLTSSISAI
jgi:hypothetical protein